MRRKDQNVRTEYNLIKEQSEKSFIAGTSA